MKSLLSLATTKFIANIFSLFIYMMIVLNCNISFFFMFLCILLFYDLMYGSRTVEKIYKGHLISVNK